MMLLDVLHYVTQDDVTWRMEKVYMLYYLYMEKVYMLYTYQIFSFKQLSSR